MPKTMSVSKGTTYYASQAPHKMSKAQRAFLGATHVKNDPTLKLHQQQVVRTYGAMPNVGAFNAVALSTIALLGLVAPVVRASHVPNHTNATNSTATPTIWANTTGTTDIPTTETPTNGTDSCNHDHHDHLWRYTAMGVGAVVGFAGGMAVGVAVGKCSKKKEGSVLSQITVNHHGEGAPLIQSSTSHFGAVDLDNPPPILDAPN